jgi:ubiquinone/menaquinone biosynthesis C-methylase UbiE
VSHTGFDRYASDYRGVVNDVLRVAGVDVDRMARSKARLLLRLMDQQLGDARALKVLDVGCGIGLVDRELVSAVGELHGIDTSRKSLEEAALAVPRARFGHFDGQRIPHPDAAFDFVFATCVLHHVPPSRRPAFILEMGRVTRAAGIVLVLEHNPLNPLTRYMVSRCSLDDGAVLLRRASALGLLAQPGLRSGGSAYISFWPWRSGSVERLEGGIGWLPVGAQYYAWATKAGGTDGGGPLRGPARGRR